MTRAYYNEIDPYAAQWLRNLIVAGHIAAGDVDERSIVDVAPSDLAGYAQCHFFAGIGVWSYALRRAGWPDDRPVWTGSCPCQPFSAAGKGNGFDDQRHLWPHFHWLIEQCRPAVVLGEQVASRDADVWVDLVHADLEALGYAFGCVPFPSAGVGAPHIRDRTYWVADTGGARLEGCNAGTLGHQRAAAQRGGAAGGLGDANSLGAGRDSGSVRGAINREDGQHGADDADASGAARGMAHHEGSGRREERAHTGRTAVGDGAQRLAAGLEHGGGLGGPGPVNGLWRAADWLACRDGKWRPVEPGTFPLAHGAPARVGRLRAYGNAINAEAARVFIEAVMSC